MSGGDLRDRCLTCGDVAVTLRVVSVEGVEAVVEGADGRTERVAVELTPDVSAGTLLLCHAGIALAVVGEASP